MDARINKQRLGNLLSYDWLKILLAIAAAVVALVLFFTMVGTRPTAGQTFTVYGYTDVRPGTDNGILADRIKSGVFSYDVLKTNSESFYANSYADAAFSARRSSGEGTVMFVSDYTAVNEEGEVTQESTLRTIAKDYLLEGKMEFFYDPLMFFSDLEAELVKFFGEDWRGGGEPNAEAVRTAFTERNARDKRYRFSEEKFEAGVLDEAERVKKLRDDYLVVEAAFEEGDGQKLAYTYYTDEDGNSYCISINVGRLSNIKRIYYYLDAQGVTSAAELNLIIFDNHDSLGDLKFETVSFLRYLLESYS